MPPDTEQLPIILGDTKFIERMAAAGKPKTQKQRVNAVLDRVPKPSDMEVLNELLQPESALEAHEALKEAYGDGPSLKELQITVNARGKIISDTAHLPEHIMAQLQTPEAQAQIREQWKTSKYADQQEPPRPIRYLNEREDRRIFADRKPPGMSGREWRHICRVQFRKMSKRVIKLQRSMPHGEQPN